MMPPKTRFSSCTVAWPMTALGLFADLYELAGKPWAGENHLLGPSDLRRLFPSEVEIRNLGMTLVATT